MSYLRVSCGFLRRDAARRGAARWGGEVVMMLGFWVRVGQGQGQGRRMGVLTRLPSGQAKRAKSRTAMLRMVETTPDAMASLVGAM